MRMLSCRKGEEKRDYEELTARQGKPGEGDGDLGFVSLPSACVFLVVMIRIALL